MNFTVECHKCGRSFEPLKETIILGHWQDAGVPRHPPRLAALLRRSPA